MVEGGGETFPFNKHMSKGLVPHSQITEEHTSLKPKVQQLRLDSVPSGAWLGAVILLAPARGITMGSHAVQRRTTIL
jgi:hypothetical protein